VGKGTHTHIQHTNTHTWEHVAAAIISSIGISPSMEQVQEVAFLPASYSADYQ